MQVGLIVEIQRMEEAIKAKERSGSERRRDVRGRTPARVREPTTPSRMREPTPEVSSGVITRVHEPSVGVRVQEATVGRMAMERQKTYEVPRKSVTTHRQLESKPLSLP